MLLVKSVFGNLNGVSFVRFDFAKGVIIKILDKFQANGTDEKVCFGNLTGKDFVITTCMLHYNSERRFNLHKTNAANEELVISLSNGREV